MGKIEISLMPLPLVEGKLPPVHRYSLHEGQFRHEWYYPEPDTEWEDPEIYETEKYRQEDKEEYYDYETVCKKCGTRFVAYNNAGKRAMKYCPFCGVNLEEK